MAIEILITWAVQIMASLGYMGLFLLMILESMIFPIPSEAVMPFAGFLVANGTFTFWKVFLFANLGTLVGSLISYYIGLKGGRLFLEKYGKYFLVHKDDVAWSESFFQKNGEKAIFIARLIPVVRHVISVPAGIAKMNFKRFILYTLLGGIVWNTFLLFVGIKLEKHWTVISEYTKTLDVIVVFFIFFGIGFFVWKHMKRKK